MGLTCCCDTLNGYEIIDKNIDNNKVSSAKIYKVRKKIRKDEKYDYEYYAMKEMKFDEENYRRI